MLLSSPQPGTPDVCPSEACRFVAARASKGRRVHVFFDTAITSVAFDRRALCVGVRGLTVVGASDTREWSDDPFATPIGERDVTCSRCWDRYERHLIAAVTPHETAAQEVP